MKTDFVTDFESLTSREWLVTNGLGGFASSTLSGTNTRRYHGLLVAALEPPTRRTVLVSRVEETIATSRDCVLSISSNQFPGTVHPQGYRYITSFERKPLPTTTYSVCGCQLKKTVFMPYGSNTTVLEYQNTGNLAFQLRLTPLLNYRDYHSLQRADTNLDFWHEQQGNALRIYPRFGSPALYTGFSKGMFKSGGAWWRNFQYEQERERGLDFEEDCYALGEVEVFLQPGENFHLVFTLEPKMLEQNPATLLADEIERLRSLDPNSRDHFWNDLAVAADQFLVRRESTGSQTMIAGYPWFTDWGRDTMIALRGLCIALGKQEETRSIIRTFLQYLDQGMLPNRFPDQGEAPEYNTIDATLWLFPVLFEYWQKFEDLAFIREAFPKLNDILETHLMGTRYNIHVTPEGLLFGGEGLSQLTWMDARIGDYVVTPRQGCAVEINALWYNALRIYEFFASKLKFSFKVGKTDISALADKTKAAFKQHFFNEKWYLNDVVIPDQYYDTSIRPNQIYALSLPFALLSPAEEKMVLATVKNNLFTPLGLRTLSPAHPDFKPRYQGSPLERDAAYHQGTVWPFLLGEYWLACLKVLGDTAKRRKVIRMEMREIENSFYRNDCLYALSEIFDGLVPAQGKGCFQQAWSVGMILKVLEAINATESPKTDISSRKSYENNPQLA